MGWFHWQCDDSPWPAQPPVFKAILAGAAGSDETRIHRSACPNLSGQLEDARRKPIDTILCSTLDGDPELRLNSAVANQYATGVAAAVRRLANENDAKQAWIVIELDAPESWNRPLLEAAQQQNLEIVELPNHYPQGDPTLLIYTLLRRRLKPGHLPTECGVILLDAPAAAAVAGESKGRVPIGLRYVRDCRSAYFDVPADMKWREVLAAAGIGTDEVLLRAGDLPRDLAVDPDAPAGAGELTVHIMPRLMPMNPESCIRCGWCVQVCPTRAHPAMLLEAAQTGNVHRARRGRLSACIECGVCDQVCPSHLPLLAAIRKIK